MSLQHAFLEFASKSQALKFGEFTLKSGRISPYFFNAGLFSTGLQMNQLCAFYADTIIQQDIEFDVLFGPAYKGIPLATGTAMALAYKTGKEVPYAYNRKEAKDHGEGGVLVGAELKGKVLIIDDVISAGTSVRESFEIINSSGAEVAGVVTALDRQEKGQNSERSAMTEISMQFGIPAFSIASLGDLIAFSQCRPEIQGYLTSIQSYRDKYGSK